MGTRTQLFSVKKHLNFRIGLGLGLRITLWLEFELVMGLVLKAPSSDSRVHLK